MCASTLAALTQRLADTAMGRVSADLVIQNVKLINVYTREIIPNTDIAVKSGYIALVGDARHTIGETTNVVDGGGLYASPGFMDGHLHVESSMLTVREYARTVLPHGTTAIWPDPHEIANVAGEAGIRFMIDDAKDARLRVFTLMPSCVPAVAGFENAGAELDANTTARFMQDEDIHGLGEMMNFPGILHSDMETHEKVACTLREGKIATGHYSMPETGAGLNAYAACGIRCCHESVRAEDALYKMRLGIYAQIREGSAWHDLHEVVKCITQGKADARYACLVSDDTHPHTLMQQGHLDHILRRAIEEGLDPITAIQMVTLNAAQCFKVDDKLGAIAPGKLADIVLLEDLEAFLVKATYIGGELVAKDGKLVVDIPAHTCPDSVKNTVHVPRDFTADDFLIAAPPESGDSVRARVIRIIEAKVGTISETANLPVVHGLVGADILQGINLLAVIERHHNTGEMGRGFVAGLNLSRGAIASTVAHDAHNLMVVGACAHDMALAANTLKRCGGGMVAVLDGEVIALLELPVAGLMSEAPVHEVDARVKALDQAWKTLGCELVSPFMTTALISLAVLPELRLTNKGLIDTVNFQFAKLFV